jgi:hypothetical protein
MSKLYKVFLETLIQLLFIIFVAVVFASLVAITAQLWGAVGFYSLLVALIFIVLFALNYITK